MTSDEHSFFSCVYPSGLAAPYRITSDKTSITVGWQQPQDDGGCEIIGYAVFADNGSGGTLIEMNMDDDPQVREQPGLNSLKITALTPLTVGSDY